MRQCPTPEGGPGSRPLIAHQISACVCVERQQEYYHKCHRCVFRGKPLDLGLPETSRAQRNGSVAQDRDQLRVEQTVELPSRNRVLVEESRDERKLLPAVPRTPR